MSSWRKSPTTTGLLIGLLLVFSLTFFGCGTETTPTDDVEEQKVLRASAYLDVEVMDPAHYVSSVETMVGLVIYSNLYQFKPGQAELVLDAAEWVEVSEDGLTISFKLKEGIQFHRGYGEMTAEDVKFSFERMVDPERQSEYAADWQGLVRVDVTGTYTGELVFSEPFAPLFVSTIPWGPGSILSKAAWEDLGDEFVTNPVGSGPYYWDEWTPNQVLVLSRFEDFYGDAPYYDRIELYPMTDARVSEMAFDRGDLDVALVSQVSMERYMADPTVTLHKMEKLFYQWLGFNVEHPPFDDIRVREAIRYAVDVDQIIEGAYQSVPSRANAMLAPGMLGYWEDAPHYEVDLERAKQLLEAAGYPDGLKVRLATAAGYEQYEAAIQIVQQQLARVGIEVELEVLESGVAWTALADYPGMHYIGYSAVLDPGYWFEWFTTYQIDMWNYWRWSNPEYDELKDLAAVTMDMDERAQMYIRMQEIIDEDITSIWITNDVELDVVRDVQPYYLGHYRQYRYFRGN